ncbi:MAG: hypothetical protein JWR89_4628 [Tardiphaga sp.]|uniref:hypothetical protein n=1 Tax=Tardiphaga sp. TaxID=1926292 RepID=UPI00261CC08C|nr:hypothetical protein [Tardiphaga sp.]MDB5504726.1 hypothetical protein [Tardiphaga sp.]
MTFRCWAHRVAFVVLAFVGTTAVASAEVVTFDAATGLGAFEFLATGDGKPGEWSIIKSDAIQGLAQTGTDPTDNRFPIAVYRTFSDRNVDLSTRFMAMSGKVDQAGGVIFRLTSANDYYVVRANALENNVRFYRVRAGRREMIAGADAPVPGKAWHTLGVVAKGDRFTVSFDGQELFTATDGTFPDGGRVGLWTKADSVTWFERFEAKSLD